MFWQRDRHTRKKSTYTQYNRLTNRQKSRFIDKQKFTQKDSTYTNRLKEQAERLKTERLTNKLTNTLKYGVTVGQRGLTH